MTSARRAARANVPAKQQKQAVVAAPVPPESDGGYAIAASASGSGCQNPHRCESEPSRSSGAAHAPERSKASRTGKVDLVGQKKQHRSAAESKPKPLTTSISGEEEQEDWRKFLL